MKWFKKKVEAPSGQVVELEGLHSWTVRWESKTKNYPYTVRREECEVFTNPEDAEHFAAEVRNAFKLIRHTAESAVTVEKTK